MSDLFHERVPDEFIQKVFCIMGMASRHSFQVLTKRTLRMEEWFGSRAGLETHSYAMQNGWDWPLPNVWLGASIEDQDAADERIVSLLSSPAAIRFLSVEPMIDEIDLSLIPCPNMKSCGVPDPGNCSVCCDPAEPERCVNGYFNALDEGLDWVIVGCETGARSVVRPMKEGWVRLLRDQCDESGKAFFYKQAKDDRGKTIDMPLLDGRKYEEYPG
jgi:protein gp37